MPRGGKRIGAGRPESGRKKWVVSVTDTEKKALLIALAEIRQYVLQKGEDAFITSMEPYKIDDSHEETS